MSSNGKEEPLPHGWDQRITADGKVYYVNHHAKTTQWTDPRVTQKDVRKQIHVTSKEMRDMQEKASKLEEDIAHFKKTYNFDDPELQKRVLKKKKPTSSFSMAAARAQFLKHDINGNGAITRKELYTVLIDNDVLPVDAKVYVADYFNLVDTDHNGTVDFEEFLDEFTRMALFRTVNAIKFTHAFSQADKNHDGVISKDELQACLAEHIGSDAAALNISHIFNEIDRNHDGGLSIDELIAWYVQRQKNVVTRQDILARTRQRQESIPVRRYSNFVNPGQ